MGGLIFKTSKDDMEKSEKGFFDLSATDIEGKETPFTEFKDRKAILVVNVASKCGYTKANYIDLKQIYKDHKADGLEILIFPANQFMG